MSRRPFLVVAGLPDFAREIESTQVFPQTITAGSVGELLEAFSRPDLAKRRPDDVVLVFADNLTENHQLPLVEVLRRLTGAGYHVIVVSVTARGGELARQFPKAGLLPLPLRINSLLYAVNAFGYQMEPIAEEAPVHEPERNTVSPSVAAGTPAAPTAGGWGRAETPGTTTPAPAPTPAGGWAPADRGAPAQPAAGGWGRTDSGAAAPEPRPVTAEPTPAAGGWGRVENAPAPAGPAAGGWTPVDRGAPAEGPARRTPPQGPPVAGPPAGAPVRPAGWQPGSQPGPQPGPAGRPVLFPGREAPSTQPAAQPAAPQNAGNAPWAPVERQGAYPSAPAGSPRRGHVITIAVSKGGTGKSSLTLNLAAFLGMRLRMLGKTVCVIDANFQQADSGKYLDQYTPNINTIANDPRLLTRERILEGLVHRPEYNLSVLLGPATPDEGNPWNINEDLYVEILDLLREHYDYILIDTPVAEKYHGIFQKFALPRADYIIVPVAPNFQTLHNAFNWLNSAVVQPRHAGGAGVDPSRIGIVLNRAEDGIGCTEEDVRQTMARWEFLGSIPERKEWKLANNRHELIAPKAYAELNQAFAKVLYRATGEAVLLNNIEATEKPRGLKSLLGRIGRGGA